MIRFLFFLALALNSVAVTLFFLYAFRQRGRIFSFATFSLLAGTVSLTLMLLFSGLAKAHHPVTTTFQAYNFSALLLLLIYFMAEHKFKIRLLGTFLLPLALFLSLLSAVIPDTEFQVEGFYSGALFSVHTALAILGEAFLALAFVASLMYLIQEKHLRTKAFKGMFFSLPSLSTLEKTSSFSLLLGVPILTAGLLLGFLLAAYTLGGTWLLDPKTLWSVVTWTLYSLLFIHRVSGRLRGRKFALLCVFGFLLVIFCYGAANYLSSFHDFFYPFRKGS